MRPASLLVLPFTLAACIENTPVPVVDPVGNNLEDSAAPELVSVTVSPDSVTLPTTRDSDRLTAEAAYSDGTLVDVTDDCAWTVEDDTVAFVDSAGGVHGVGVGDTVARCGFDGEADTADVRVDTLAPARAGDLVFNELLADPPPGSDPNGDGTADPKTDEFVELVNAARYTVDLGDSTLWDTQNEPERHHFAPGTVLRPGEAVVVFGGGTANVVAERCTAVITANADSSLHYGLALNNEGDSLSLRDIDGDTIVAVTYGDAVTDAAFVLDPEIDGADYTDHRTVAGSVGPFSPCTRADGRAFPTVAERLGE